MKNSFYYLCIGLVCVVSLNSCDDDDDILASQVPLTVKTTFETKFPNVTLVKWEKNRGYYLAEFWNQTSVVEAWFGRNGNWCMTETNLGFSTLPKSIQVAFQSSQYMTWRIEDLYKYERPTDTFYLIEVEKNGQLDRNLFYAEDGLLLKNEVDKEDFEVAPDIMF